MKPVGCFFEAAIHDKGFEGEYVEEEEEEVEKEEEEEDEEEEDEEEDIWWSFIYLKRFSRSPTVLIKWNKEL